MTAAFIGTKGGSFLSVDSESDSFSIQVKTPGSGTGNNPANAAAASTYGVDARLLGQALGVEQQLQLTFKQAASSYAISAGYAAGYKDASGVATNVAAASSALNSVAVDTASVNSGVPLYFLATAVGQSYGSSYNQTA